MFHGYRRGGSPALVALAAVAASALAGCSSLAPDAPSAEGVAVAFAAALDAGNATEACAMLAPGTVEEIESSEDTSCDAAVLQLGLPSGGQGLRAEAFGRGAIVELDNDTLFLVGDGDGDVRGWRVTAAGCEPRPERPYDCTVKGG
ncbi:hypothetical protein [Planctomonas deserti]|uniref:hypothetical protein n=1 Tax=Planctomonas deserti TaxID=2144185 RepID=UPI000D3893D5|nr:hypothetical protein [Planctomonas deserti]